MNTMVAVIGLVIVGGLIVATFTIQMVRTQRSAVGRVLSLFREAKHNENLARKFGYRGRVAPFRTDVWLRYKREVDFLPAELLELMEKTYDELFRLNEAIGGSVERHQESQLNMVNTAPVREQLTDMRRRLDLWSAQNLNNPAYAPRRPRFLWF